MPTSQVAPFRRARVPGYRRQQSAGRADRAFVELNGKRIMLGRYGSPESRQQYERITGEWLANHRMLPVQIEAPHSGLTVIELAARFWLHAESYYGTSGELANYRDALRPLKKLYGTTPVADFGPKALKTVRDWMIRAGWCRNYINRQLKRIVRVFKWGVESELIEPNVHLRLAAVESLRKQRSAARETDKVEPVTLEQVDSVRPFLPQRVEALMDLHWRTGARSGELLKLRPIDVTTGETEADNWTYSPPEHKTAHHGHERIIEFGPKAKSILTVLMAGHPMDVRLFQSHTRSSYRTAIGRACDKAFPPPERLLRLRVSAGGRKKLRRETRDEWKKRLGADAWAELQAWKKEHRWHPHQLRHAFATRVRNLAGLENARIAAGHSKASMTEHYAKSDRSGVTALLKKIG